MISMIESKNNLKLLTKKYFISLANTRGSVNTLRIHSISLFILSIIGLIPGMEINSWYNNPISMVLYGILKFYVAYAILLNLLLFLVPYKKVYEHQIVTTILLFFTLVAELVILLALSFMISNGKSTGYKSNSADFNATYSTIFLIIIGIVVLLSTCYNVFRLRKNLRDGFSEQRNAANYLAVSTVFNSNSVLIIFGVVSITSVIFINFYLF